jgi:adenine-specific DNA methylase
MSAPAISDPVQREAAYRRIEQVVQEAAEAERAAYLHWQEAYGAYEMARDEASAEWTAWAEDIAP